MHAQEWTSFLECSRSEDVPIRFETVTCAFIFVKAKTWSDTIRRINAYLPYSPCQMNATNYS